MTTMTLFIGLLRGIDKRAARSGMAQVALGPEYGLVGQRFGLNQLIEATSAPCAVRRSSPIPLASRPSRARGCPQPPAPPTPRFRSRPSPRSALVSRRAGSVLARGRHGLILWRLAEPAATVEQSGQPRRVRTMRSIWAVAAAVTILLSVPLAVASQALGGERPPSRRSRCPDHRNAALRQGHL
jgi:hypothetical protein